MDIIFWITVSLYGLTSAVYILYLFRRTDRVRQIGRFALLVTFFAHLGSIGSLCYRGVDPLSDTSGLLRLTGWIVIGGYLLTGFKWRIGVLGAMVVPFAMALLIGSYLTIGNIPVILKPAKVLGWFHMIMAALGVATFALAAAVSVVYLYQEVALKKKRLDVLCRRTPALGALDDLGRQLILIGFPIFTMAVISGIAWVTQFPKLHGFRAEYLVSGLTWLVFCILIVARSWIGLRGRRAALITVLGFLGTWVVLVIYIGRKVFGQ